MALTCDPKDPRAPEWLRRVCRNLKWVPFVFILFFITYGYLTVTVSLALRYHLARKGKWVSAFFEVLFCSALAGGAIWSFIVAVFKDPGSPSRGRGGDREGWGGQDVEGEEVQSLMRGHEDESARAGMFNVPIPGQPQYPARSGRQQLDNLQSLSTHVSASSSGTIERRSNIWVKSSGESRWCAKCDAPKPDRTHHCSRCARCVLRMDHHCPWLANRCVGLRNHKPFFLFIAYTGLFCAYCCQETARALLWYVEYENNGFETSPISWAVVLFLGFIFGSSLIPFAGYHAYLICKNRTSIESMEGSGRVRLRVKRDERRPRVEDRLRGIVRNSMEAQHPPPQQQQDQRRQGRDEGVWRSDEHLTREERRALKKASKLNVYDVGIGCNWRQIMGDVWYLWFVPIGTPPGDGFSYLVQTRTLKQLEEITASIRVRDQQLAAAQGHERRSEEEDEDGDGSVYGDREATRFGYAEEERPARETGMGRKAGQRFQGAHGEMEWGDAPKKSFVLFGVEDEDE